MRWPIPSHVLKHIFPTIAFFGGFLWDAFTLGRSVKWLDLSILLAYLTLAGGILWWLGHRKHLANEDPTVVTSLGKFEHVPYLALQFLFGGLFSALFIFYFKSASHVLAFFAALALGGLLVLNEFIHEHYHRFSLTWALFGLCAMLLFNFILPYAVGSIHAAWFYISTLAGAALAHALRKKTPGVPGRAYPVWVIAGVLSLAYLLDVIPPVPLVKKELQVGTQFSKDNNDYVLYTETHPWWKPWTWFSHDVHIISGESVYCISTVFAPKGLQTKLYHRWQRFDAHRGWVTQSRIGFSLSGGRNGGFRGYTYKQQMQAGKWRVIVETETERTLSVMTFDLLFLDAQQTPPEKQAVHF